MVAAIGSAALIVVASLTVGQAILTLCGRRQDRVAAGPVGLAALLAAAAIVAGLDGGGTAIAITLGALLVPAAAIIAVAGLPAVGAEVRLTAVAAGVLAGLAAALPFIAAGAVGILGVGLVNDDMASHLLLADWIDQRFRPEPRLIDQGYPLGPHAAVAGLADLLHATSIDVFAGLTLAIPALTAFTVSGVLETRRASVRVACATLVALPYLAAAYLAQEAFKEPILALLLLTFALLLPGTRSARAAIPLGIVAAGTIYVYSFPGLAWLAGTALIWAAISLSRRAPGTGRPRKDPEWSSKRPGDRQSEPGSDPAGDARSPAPENPPARSHPAGDVRLPALLTTAVGVATLIVLTGPEIGRLIDFREFRALDPDRANEGGLGNLRGHLSPLEALGIWPTSAFRLSAGDGSVPAIVFYAGAALAAAALAMGLPRWLRRHGPAIPAALLTAALIYVAARAFGTVYTSAKALAIAAPLITLITLGGLLTPVNARVRLLPIGLAAVVMAAGAFSSFLILRQAPVGPEDHMDELAEIRPLVEGEKLLFLGRDNFVLYELRGSKPFTAVRNFYDPYYVQPNTALEDVFSKFDFDSVTAETLARFRYVLATRAAYASGAPPAYQPVAETESYVLWEKRGPIGDRRPGEDDAAPGRVGGCEGPVSRVDSFARAPVVAADWSSPTIEDDEPATIEVELPAGAWDLSLQYDATRPLTLSGQGFEAELPGNLDYRGTTPFWDAGEIELERRATVRIAAEVERPPLAGRLLGTSSVAHLGALAATRAGAPVQRADPACAGYVDWYEPR